MVRRHALSERLLTDILGLSWVEAHAEAHKFEHIISPKVEARLMELLHNPNTCPHGNPIPGVSGAPVPPRGKPLSAADYRQTGGNTKEEFFLDGSAVQSPTKRPHQPRLANIGSPQTHRSERSLPSRAPPRDIAHGGCARRCRRSAARLDNLSGASAGTPMIRPSSL